MSERALAAPVPGKARRAGAGGARAMADTMTYLVVGLFFGAVLVKGEVISWFRIQEMFRFQSFHMFGVLGSAIATAAVSLQLLKRYGVRARGGEAISIAPKVLGRGYRYGFGGSIFGVGWALTGACPGPLFALVGSGSTVFVVVLMAALAGTWAYGHARPHLPH